MKDRLAFDLNTQQWFQRHPEKQITVDEQIEFCKEKIKNIKLNTEPSIFEDIKESLEELERYRKDYAWAERRAYKKALDDFIEKMNEQSEFARPVGWSSRIEIITMSTVRSIKEELMKEEATQNENC